MPVCAECLLNQGDMQVLSRAHLYDRQQDIICRSCVLIKVEKFYRRQNLAYRNKVTIEHVMAY